MLGFRVRESGWVLENYKYKFTNTERGFLREFIIYIPFVFRWGRQRSRNVFLLVEKTLFFFFFYIRNFVFVFDWGQFTSLMWLGLVWA